MRLVELYLSKIATQHRVSMSGNSFSTMKQYVHLNIPETITSRTMQMLTRVNTLLTSEDSLAPKAKATAKNPVEMQHPVNRRQISYLRRQCSESEKRYQHKCQLGRPSSAWSAGSSGTWSCWPNCQSRGKGPLSRKRNL